jgi:hypothetical protein
MAFNPLRPSRHAAVDLKDDAKSILLGADPEMHDLAATYERAHAERRDARLGRLRTGEQRVWFHIRTCEKGRPCGSCASGVLRKRGV